MRLPEICIYFLSEIKKKYLNENYRSMSNITINIYSDIDLNPTTYLAIAIIERQLSYGRFVVKMTRMTTKHHGNLNRFTWNIKSNVK